MTDAPDIVARLRAIAWGDIGDDGLSAIDEAAAEIERLRKEPYEQVAMMTKKMREMAQHQDVLRDRLRRVEEALVEIRNVRCPATCRSEDLADDALAIIREAP